MTVSVWVRPLARDAERGIISKYLHFFPEVCDFYVSIQTPDVGAITRITAQGFDGLDGDAPKQGVWSHMSVVFRGTQGNATLYINGKAIGTAPLTFNPEPGPLPLRIGVTRGGDHLGVFKGGIDDVRIYERALTPTEVKALALESDSDGDGTPDHEDECLDSDLRATVVIDGCNSGVPSTVFPSGCTISDLIAACAEGASNHGQFVSCVSHLTNDLKKTGTIIGQQKGAIQSCAAQAGSE